MANEDKGVATVPKRSLPKIDDLYKDKPLAQQHNELSQLLNHPPKAEWLKPHPTAKKKLVGEDGKYVLNAQGKNIFVPIDYMPIGIIEYLAASIFIKTRTEVKSVQHIANSVVVTVKVWVMDPITMEWDWQEGVGAAPMRTDSGKGALEWNFIQDSAVQTAAPAAKTFAEKDAYEKFGAIFGRDLNRAEDMLGNYENLGNKLQGEAEVTPELKLVIEEAADFDAIRGIFKANPMLQGNEEFVNLLDERKEQIRDANAKTEEDGK